LPMPSKTRTMVRAGLSTCQPTFESVSLVSMCGPRFVSFSFL
jgi:hypothetical protein